MEKINDALRTKLEERNFEDELYKAILLLETKEEMKAFFKDLCTPQEISAMAERWKVCQLLERGDLSYRDINALTGASLTTIGRVARFIKDEDNRGYINVLAKLSPEEKL